MTSGIDIVIKFEIIVLARNIQGKQVKLNIKWIYCY